MPIADGAWAGLAIALCTAACVSYDDPGRFDPRSPVEGSEAVSALSVRFAPWTASGGPEVALRFDEAMTAHLGAARLLPAPSADGAQVLLEGDVQWAYSPERGGLVGPQAEGPHILLWIPLLLFGVPAEWVTAEAHVVLIARDPPSGVALWSWDTGAIAETAYAGLYYHPAPLARALRAAADRLEAMMRASLGELAAQVAVIDGWTTRYATTSIDGLIRALDDPNAAIRGRALVGIGALGMEGQAALAAVRARATDGSPDVRARVIDTLVAIGAHDATTRAVVGALCEDDDRRVSSSAMRAARQLAVLAEADALADRALAEAVALLAHPQAEVRIRGLDAIAARGTAAGPAAPAVRRLLAWTTVEPERRAAIATLLAAGRLNAEIDATLADAARGSGDVARAAALTLAQLRATAETAEAAPPVLAATPDVDPAPASAAHRPVVAVFELEGGALTTAQRSELTTLLSAQLTALSRFKIVPQGRVMTQIQEAKAETYRACYDTACQIEIGKAVAAEMIVSSKIIEQARGCVISSTLYDLRTEATEQAAVVEGACTPAALSAMLKQVAEALRRAP